MKNPSASVVLRARRSAACLLVFSLGINGVFAAERTAPNLTTTPAVTTRGPHHRLWEWTTPRILDDGTVFPEKHSYTELQSGMHYLKNGEWTESSEQIELLQDGAIAEAGQHQVIFAANLNSDNALVLLTPDGKKLRSRVVGLAYYDAQSGGAVWVSLVKDSIGALVGNNQVLYEDAFADVKADVRYTYTRHGLEQDVILRQDDLPSPAAFGLNPNSTRLEVVTEFFQPPAPALQEGVIEEEKDAAVRRTMATPDFSDQVISFGAMHIGQGKAFMIGGETAEIAVGKSWNQIDGRTFLVEAVKFEEVRIRVQALPKPVARNAQQAQKVQPQKDLLAKVAPAPEKKPGKLLRMAQLPLNNEGLVLDYSAVNSQPALTFKGDTTYYVSGPVNLSGATTIEGGAVIKYANTGSPQITINSAGSSIQCLTAPYRPAIFTSKDDNTVGEIISGSTGNPSGTYAITALSIDANAIASDVNLSNLRFRYAQTAVYLYTHSHTLSHIQFLNCTYAINPPYATVTLRNILANQIASFFYYCYGTAVNGEHLTLHNIGSLYAVYVPTVTLANSLLVKFTTSPVGSYTAVNSPYVPSDVGVFQTKGGADHYLADGSQHRDAGTPNISSVMLNDLATRTTFPPSLFSGTSLSANTTWTKNLSWRDTGTPDCGYHYDVLDYLVSGLTLNSSTLLLTEGVAVAFDYSAGSWGFILNDSKIISQGSPLNWNHIVRAHMVQERSTGNPGMRSTFYDGWSWTSADELRLRFTRFAQSANDGYAIYTGQKFSAIELSHSALYNSSFVVDTAGGNVLVCGVTNTLWSGGAGQFGLGSSSANSTVHVRNCLFRNFAQHFIGAQASWTVNDNLVDNGGFYDHYVSLNHAKNAYYQPQVAGSFPGTLLGSGDLPTLTSLSYQSVLGVGEYYALATPSLSDAGSTTADQVGLYHFTAQTAQNKEGNSVVDIGLHYVAMNANNQPIDSDGDGLPDYVEDQPTISVTIADELIYENGPVSGKITLTRSGANINAALPIHFTLSGVANGTDIATVTSPVTIDAGTSSKTVLITPIDNAVVNLSRTALLTVSGNSGYVVDGMAQSGSVEILDNELPAVSVTVSDASAGEPANNGQFTLTRSQNLSQPLTVNYILSGTGRNEIDFALVSGEVQFAASAPAAVVNIQPIDNDLHSGTRDVTLTISPGLDYIDGTPEAATIMLTDNEVPMVRVFASIAQAVEGGASGVFTFVRDGSPRTPLTVSFSLSGASGDYQTFPLSITFAEDEHEKILSIIPINDTAVEGAENLQLTIQTSSSYAIMLGRETATVTILDNDLPTVNITIEDTTASEPGTDTGKFRFTRSPVTSEELKVYYAVTGTASNNYDYVYLPGAAIIPAGAAYVDVTVVPLDDPNPLPPNPGQYVPGAAPGAEYTETATVRLAGSTNYLVGANYRQTINILDNEPLTYSYEVTRPYAVSYVANGLAGLSPQSAVNGEITIRRVGLLPLGNVNMTFTHQGGTPSYTHNLTLAGNTLTFQEPTLGGTPPSMAFPAGQNEIRLSVGKRLWNSPVNGQVGFPNAQIWILIDLAGGALNESGSLNMQFVSPNRAFGVTRVSPYWGAEGSSTFLFQFSRAASGVAATANYLISGSAFPSDHNLDGSVSFTSAETFKNVVMTAVTDTRIAEGWETVDVSIDPGSGAVNSGPARVWIRDSPQTGTPPFDADEDGLTDAFETTYSALGFNMNVYNDPNTDIDLDGASELEEQTYGMNPSVKDSNADGVSDGAQATRNKGIIPDFDTVPVKFAAASCTACHQTTLKVGTYELTSKHPRLGDNSAATRIEQIMHLKKGQSYPVSIDGPIRRDVLKTATYTAEVLEVDPAQLNFILDDPNQLLGVDRPTGGIDTKTATLTVPKVEVTWLTKPGVGNVPIDDNLDPVSGQPMYGGGKRIFVGALSPSDSANPRSTVIVKVKMTPPPAPSPAPPRTVFLKAFDVDDATHPGFDVDAAGQRVINTSPAGADNNPDSVTSPAGYFLSTSGVSVSGTLDANGEAQFEFRVSAQPGNNYRVAATVFPMNANNLNSLQVATPGANYFVPAIGNEIKSGFNGALSPLLTVWRKLHLEFDSMSAVQGNTRIGTLKIVQAGTGGKNRTALFFTDVDPILDPFEGPDGLQNGTVSFGGNTYLIRSNTGKQIGNRAYAVLTVDGTINPPLNSTGVITDDDDFLLAEAGVSPSLPRLAAVPNIITKLQENFTSAFILLVDANAAGWNPANRSALPFRLFEPPTKGLGAASVTTYKDVKDLQNSANFWSHLISFGYQSDATEDGEPNGEPPLYGGTPKAGMPLAKGVSVVLVEGVREKWFEKVPALPQFRNWEILTPLYWNRVIGCVAHEMAHAPGSNGETGDHEEKGLLERGNIDFKPYSPLTVKRFRTVQSWEPVLF